MKRFWLVSLAVLFATLVTAQDEDNAGALAALKRAYKLRKSWKKWDDPEFVKEVEKAFPLFPSVPVATEFGKATFTKVTLNKHGANLCGVRFKVPPGKKKAVVFGRAFHKPAERRKQKLERSKMLYVDPRRTEFTKSIVNPKVEKAPWPSEYTSVLWAEPAGYLKPGKEYCHLYQLMPYPKGTFDLYFAVCLVDDKDMQARGKVNSEQWVLALGLKPGDPASASKKEGGVDLRFNLGPGGGGILYIKADKPDPALTSPSKIEVMAGDSAKKILGRNGVLRQVSAPTCLVDIVVADAFRYEIRFYKRKQLGSRTKAGIYALSGKPYVTYILENPDKTPGKLRRFRNVMVKNGKIEKATVYTYDEHKDIWRVNEN